MRGVQPFFDKMFQITLNRTAVFLVGFLVIATAYASWIDRMERKFFGVKPGVYIEEHNVGGFLPEELDVVMDELVIKHREMPRDPALNRETGEIIPEADGWEVDVPGTVHRVFAALPDARVHLVKMKIASEHRAEELRPVVRQLGYFHTYAYGSWERHQNIALALMSINNRIVWPGGIFSFNETVGPRTPERGYRPAPIMGGDGIGFGGGVCQVSTTLYNAVLESGLKVVERSPHSSKVPYVAAGKDATVVYGAQDLTFANNLDHPIIVKAGISRGKVAVYILGK